MKDKILSITLICIIVLKIADLSADVSDDASVTHLIQESILILISSALFLFLIFDIRQRSNDAKALKAELAASSAREQKVTAELQQSKQHFLKAIQAQFDVWGLTPSEKEVAMFLLRGLTLLEIAEMRSTSEKTIRHHASAIYRKADCKGRHELAALFFENLI
ncbi:helix-turn-helix transcriptional regulator [Alteromonas sp. A081]|uniref:helix-turn-helix transcriptional regulator n=1 Tax=Alteromonas sp. A081 TaxID=3410269 RepID=UPI003B9853DD